MRHSLASLATMFLLLSPSLPSALDAQAGTPSYRLLQRVTVGGEGGWDYLFADTAGHRLYLSHSTRVEVLDLDDLHVVGSIANTNGVHGIAVDGAIGRGFTSNGRDSTVTVFDLRNLATIQTVHVPAANPDAIIYDRPSGRVFTFNGGSHSATAIDAATGAIAGTIALSGKPEFAVSDGLGKIFVNIEDRSSLAAIDTRTLAVLAEWPLAPCESPSGLSFDAKHRRLFSGCDNKVMAVSDADAGRVVATATIGDGVDATAFDASRGLAFSSNGEGTITVVRETSPDSVEVVATIPTQRGARTMTLDPRTGRLFTVTAEYGPAPAPTPDRPRPRPSIVPGSFTLLVVGP